MPDVTTLALTCLVLLGTGYPVLIGIGLIPRFRAFSTEAWPILFTETLIVGVAVGAIWIGGWVLAFLLVLMTLRIGYEAAEVAQSRHGRANRRVSAVIGAALACVALLCATLPLGLLCVCALVAVALCVILLRTNSSFGLAVDLVLFPAIPLIVFVAAGLQGSHAAWLLISFLLVETFDSYALAGGKLFGKHKAFPVLSPEKTVEGLVIGAAILVLTAALAGKVLSGAPIGLSCAVALAVGALAVTGDLAASRLKRRGGVKDYPAVVPRQGGLLDITDAWITAGAGLIVIATLAGPG